MLSTLSQVDAFMDQAREMRAHNNQLTRWTKAAARREQEIRIVVNLARVMNQKSVRQQISNHPEPLLPTSRAKRTALAVSCFRCHTPAVTGDCYCAQCGAYVQYPLD